MRDLGPLLAGFARFRRRYFVEDRTLFERLAQGGQDPCAIVVACSDARVDPVILTDSRPGDLFIVRNVANLVPPWDPQAGYHGTSAALEFAVCVLGVPHVIVLGHTQCGGVRALLTGVPASAESFLAPWVELARPARERVLRIHAGEPLAVQAAACEQEAIRLSLGHLRTFPWIRERVGRGTLALHGWHFDLEHGELLGLDAATDRFVPLVPSA